MNYFYLVVILLLFIIVFVPYIGKNKKKEGLTNKKTNIILIGDSMLNNSDYMMDADGKDTSIAGYIGQRTVDESLQVTLHNYAKNHATISDCYAQMDQISLEPGANTMIVVSAGGNDIVNQYRKFGRIDDNFVSSLFQKYSQMVLSINNKTKSTNCNTSIYLLNLYKPAKNILSNLYPIIDQWNSMIQDFAQNNEFKIIPTNKIMVLESDFVYNYEPSKTGGQKIADAILSNID